MAAPVCQFLQGQFVFQMGDPARSLYAVRTGLLKASIVSEDGRELTVRLFGPGELFGECSLYGGQRRVQVTALQASEVVEVAVSDLVGQLQNDRAALAEFLRTVVGRVFESYDQTCSLGFEKTLPRLGRVLLTLAEKLGRDTRQGVELQHYIRQEDLAQMIAARREAVSSALNRLRAAGLIDYRRRGRLRVRTRRLRAWLRSLRPPARNALR